MRRSWVQSPPGVFIFVIGLLESAKTALRAANVGVFCCVVEPGASPSVFASIGDGMRAMDPRTKGCIGSGYGAPLQQLHASAQWWASALYAQKVALYRCMFVVYNPPCFSVKRFLSFSHGCWNQLASMSHVGDLTPTLEPPRKLS